ncbi:MAG: glycosyltransferase [Chloroflexi bacterium]|nr:glycosyltransferase [Chloroflexota bacterium]
MRPSELRVALVQDFLVHMRGAERQFRSLSAVFPGADVYALVADPRLAATEWKGHRLITSFVDRLPLARRTYRGLLPLYPHAIERFDFSHYDLVFSNSMGFVHGAITQPATCHISWCMTPLRYAWAFYHEFLTGRPVLQRVLLHLLLHRIRNWDRQASTRVDYFLANSAVTRRRIQKFYGRESRVMYPPIDVSAFRVAESYDDFYLIVSALMPYKRLDVAVEAFTQLGLPLKIVGTGPDARRLMAMAGPNVDFLGWRSDRDVRDAYARCRAFIMTADEDFGLTPLEAQASGRPVIAYGSGGVLETMVDGVTGVFFRQQTAAALAETVSRFDARAFRPDALREHARRFDVSAFEPRLRAFVSEALGEYRDRYALPSLTESARTEERPDPAPAAPR